MFNCDCCYLYIYDVYVKGGRRLETSELQTLLHNLDNQTQQAGNNINALSGEINNLYSQAENCRATADSLLNRAVLEEDANRSADMASQASAYLSRAEYYESSAAQMESQVEELRGELRGYRHEYEYYMGEGETNLANLEIAVNKLTRLTGAKYGGDKIRQTLEQTRHRIVFNRKLVEGCKKRINWIDRICGNAGGQPDKRYTLH